MNFWSFFDFNSRYVVLEVSEAVVQRSSRSEVFCTKGALKILQNSQENHCARVSFFNKVAGLRSATLLKKRLWHSCSPTDFAKFLRSPFFTEHLQWLLLKFISHHTKEILYVNTNLMGNQPWSKNKHFLGINVNFYQFHERIFRSSRSQMFFKIGALKNFAILMLTCW